MVRPHLLCFNALLSWFQSCKETMDRLKEERVAINHYHNFLIMRTDEEVCQWMREQQGLPPQRVGNCFVSSLLDPMILGLIILLQQIFSIYTGAQAGPSARCPSSWTEQEGGS